MPKTLLYTPLSWLYGAAIKLRHKLYDMGILRVNHFDIPIICIGNITVGGTGKTPLTELVASHFAKKRKVAILSRGYGRKTKGYLEVMQNSHYRDVGDEPLQIKMKYPNLLVVVCEDRVAGIKKIKELHPDIELIVMDDGFQHRSVEALINIVTVDATRPTMYDKLLPLGNLRDITESFNRAHYFVVTKCPTDITPLTCRLFTSELITHSFQQVYFTRFRSFTPQALYPKYEDPSLGITSNSKVIALSGVGNPRPFVDSIAKKFNLVDEINFEDHHVYKIKDLKLLLRKLDEHPDSIIITTEKDAVKLIVSSKIPKELRRRIYYMPINISFINTPISEFLNNLEQDVKHNQANSAVSKL